MMINDDDDDDDNDGNNMIMIWIRYRRQPLTLK